jgi:cytochrome c biogenesis protein CcmG, thiol:disulfide interchange protein DsbE
MHSPSLPSSRRSRWIGRRRRAADADGGDATDRGRRSRWARVAALVAVVAPITMLLAFGLTHDPSVTASPLIGRSAPDFVLRTLDGTRTIRLRQLRGRVVVVNFWASWCVECRAEHPNLLAAWNRFRHQGLALVGIDFDDRNEAALEFMRQMGGDWPVLQDPGDRTALDYGVSGVPETFFIGRDGVIRYKQVGPSSYALLVHQIERLLHEAR